MRIEVQRQRIYLAIALLVATIFLSQVSRLQAAVKMSNFTATSDSDTESATFVRLDWITQTEESSSFLIQRVEENDTFTQPSGNIQDYENGDDIISVQYNGATLDEIPSLGGPTNGAVYTANDRSVEAGKTYKYRIVEIDLSGILNPVTDSNFIPMVEVIDPDSNSGTTLGGDPTATPVTPEPTEETPTVEATVTKIATSASEDATETPEATETPTETPEPEETEESTTEAEETTSDSEETPEPTNTPTATPTATETPEPTSTPEPTATQTPVADNATAPAATLVVVSTSTPQSEDSNEDSAEPSPTPPAEAIVEERSADPEESSDTTDAVASVAVTSENEEKAEAQVETQAIAGVAVAEAAESDEPYPVESMRVEEVSVDESGVVEVEAASGESYPVSAEIDTASNNSAAASAVTADNGNLLVFPTIEPSAAGSGNSINSGSNASQIGGNTSSGDVIGGDSGNLAPPVQTGGTSSNSDSGGSGILLWVVFGAGILVFIAGVIGSILIFTRQRED